LQKLRLEFVVTDVFFTATLLFFVVDEVGILLERPLVIGCILHNTLLKLLFPVYELLLFSVSQN